MNSRKGLLTTEDHVSLWIPNPSVSILLGDESVRLVGNPSSQALRHPECRISLTTGSRGTGSFETDANIEAAIASERWEDARGAIERKLGYVART